nr:reverse transcriptase domain-containing protein [Tanacetum cinerariifolium]
MRLEGLATWDGGKTTWGGRVEAMGTVPVCTSLDDPVAQDPALVCFKNKVRSVKIAKIKGERRRRVQKALLESEDSEGGHWKSRSKKKKSNKAEDDLSQPWKKCIKDPIEIHNIKQQDRQSTEDFVKRYKLESRDVKGAPECMRISGFVHGITNPELIKRLHDKIPKTVDEMMRVTTSFLKGEVAASNHKRKKSFPPWKQQEDEDEGTEGPMIIEAKIRGHCIHRMYMDGGSSSEILYEHYFSQLRLEIKNQLVPANTPLIGFNGEIIWPIGQIQLLVKIGDEERSTSAWMNFVVVRKPFGYKANNGRKNQSGNKSIISGANNNDRFHSHKEGRNKLCDLLQRNLDIFAWKHADMTGVPRHIVEHRLNDVQKLNGKLTSLNKFLAKSAEKSLPFFKTLKKYTKKSDFHWTTETEEAFKQMKQLIAELSLLATLMEKEELIVYLAAAKEMVSTVLMTEIETKQMPIYFVSRALRGPHEKTSAILGTCRLHSRTTRRGLSRYSDGSGGRKLPEPWILFTDGSSCTDEYEALIAGLRIAEQMGVKNLQANVDSRLVANQVNGTYVTKEADMIRYLEKFMDNPFKDWCEKLCIRQQFASVKHPQTNGLVERANHSIGEGIKARLDARRKNWMEELSQVLWAHHTMIKSSNEDTSVSLIYRTKAVIPAEIDMPTLRTAEVDLVQNNEALEINLDLLEEKREQAAIREAKSKAKIEKY